MPLAAWLAALVLQEGPIYRSEELREFTRPTDPAEQEFSGTMDGLSAVTIGAWVCPKRSGEQAFFGRGLLECGPNGGRMFRPNDGRVNFMLGTDLTSAARRWTCTAAV